MALNYEAIMAYRPDDIAVNYGARECILYALGIGLGILGSASIVTGIVILAQPGRESPPARVAFAPWMTSHGAGAAGVMSW